MITTYTLPVLPSFPPTYPHTHTHIDWEQNKGEHRVRMVHSMVAHWPLIHCCKWSVVVCSNAAVVVFVVFGALTLLARDCYLHVYTATYAVFTWLVHRRANEYSRIAATNLAVNTHTRAQRFWWCWCAIHLHLHVSCSTLLQHILQSRWVSEWVNKRGTVLLSLPKWSSTKCVCVCSVSSGTDGGDGLVVTSALSSWSINKSECECECVIQRPYFIHLSTHHQSSSGLMPCTCKLTSMITQTH